MKILAICLTILLAVNIVKSNPVRLIERTQPEQISGVVSYGHLKRRAPPTPNSLEFLRKLARRENDGDQKKANIANFLELVKYIADPSNDIYAWQVLMLMNYDHVQFAHLLAQALVLHPNSAMTPFTPGMTFAQFTLPMYSSLYNLLPAGQMLNALSDTQAPADLVTVQQIASTIMSITDEGVLLPNWIDWNVFLRRWAQYIRRGRFTRMVKYWKLFLRQLLMQLKHGNAVGQFRGQLYAWQVILIHSTFDDGFEVMMEFIGILADADAQSPIFESIVGGVVNQQLSALIPHAMMQQISASFPELSNFLQSAAVQPVDQYQSMIQNLLNPSVGTPTLVTATPVPTSPSVPEASTDLAYEQLKEVNSRLTGLHLFAKKEVKAEEIEQLKASIKALLATNGGQLMAWHVIFAQIVDNTAINAAQQNQLLQTLIYVADIVGLNVANVPIPSALSQTQPLSAAFPLFMQVLQSEITIVEQHLSMGALSNPLAQQDLVNLSALQQFMLQQQMPNLSELIQEIQQNYPDLPPADDDADFQDGWNLTDGQEEFIDEEPGGLQTQELEETHCVGSLAEWGEAQQLVQQPPPPGENNNGGVLPGISGPSNSGGSLSASFSFNLNPGAGASGGSSLRRRDSGQQTNDPTKGTMALAVTTSGSSLTVDSEPLYQIVAKCSRECLLGLYVCDETHSSEAYLTESLETLSLSFPSLVDQESAYTLAQCVWMQLRANYSATLSGIGGGTAKCNLTEPLSKENPAVAGMPWHANVQSTETKTKGIVELHQVGQTTYYMSASVPDLFQSMTTHLDSCVAEIGTGCTPALSVRHESFSLTSTVQQIAGPLSATVLLKCVVDKFGGRIQLTPTRFSRRAGCHAARGVWIGLGSFGFCIGSSAITPNDRELLEQAPECATVPKTDTSDWVSTAQQQPIAGQKLSASADQMPRFTTLDKRQISANWSNEDYTTISIEVSASTLNADQAVSIEEYVHLATQTCIPLMLCNEPSISADIVSSLLDGGKLGQGAAQGSTLITISSIPDKQLTFSFGWQLIYCMANSILDKDPLADKWVDEVNSTITNSTTTNSTTTNSTTTVQKVFLTTIYSTPTPLPIISKELQEYCAGHNLQSNASYHLNGWVDAQVCISEFCMRPAVDVTTGSIGFGVDFTSILYDQNGQGMSEESNPQVDCHNGPAYGPLAAYLDYQEEEDCGGDFCGYDHIQQWMFDSMYCTTLTSLAGQPAFSRSEPTGMHSADLNELDFTCPEHSSIAKIVCENWRDAQKCVGPGDNGGLLGLGGCDHSFFRACDHVRVECSQFTHAKTGNPMQLEAKGEWQDMSSIDDQYPFVIGWKVGGDRPLVLRAKTKNAEIGVTATADRIKGVIAALRDECIPYVNCNFGGGKRVLGDLQEDLANGVVRVKALNGADATLLQQKLSYCMSKRYAGTVLPF